MDWASFHQISRIVDPVLNPYSPGAGRNPAALVGRDRPRSDWTVALERVQAGRSNQPFVLYGLRGVGKTVLLSDFRRSAIRRDWVGAATGRASLDSGFFRARWDRATRSEQNYMRAMSEDGDAGSSSGEIAGRMRRPPASLVASPANLIAKGLIYVPEHGVVAFTAPGMAGFILCQPE